MVMMRSCLLLDTGSIPVCPATSKDATAMARATRNGAVVQLVRMLACHAGGRGFESRPLRQFHIAIVLQWQAWPALPGRRKFKTER